MTSPRPTRLPRFVLLMAIVLMLVGCDQATKVYAVRHLKPLQHLPPRSYLADTIRIHYVENPGAFLGMGGQLDPRVKYWVLTLPTVVILVWVTAFVFASRSIDRWTFLALAMIVAGGIGNSIDRFRLGGFVIDFLNVGFGERVWQRTGIFNVADMAITAGFIMLLPYVFKGEPKPAAPVVSPPQAA